MTAQLSLWDKPTPGFDPTPRDIPVPAMGGIVELPTCWADGDKRHESLARLASVLRGNKEIIRANDGTTIWFRITATRIEGDHVVMTLKRIEPPIKSYADWLRESGERDTESEVKE